MDFIDRIQTLGKRIPQQMDHLVTEEATKHALVMPFIQALGYDVFDPREVVPEFTADVGTKKGEKVDYAIMKDGTPIMLFECKKAGADLSKEHASQLFRYFSVTKARLGVLTNGVQYRFFSDLEAPNKMDEKPFLEVDLTDISEPLVGELKNLTKSRFDEDQVISSAIELKYTVGIKRILAEEMRAPSDELVRLLAKQVYAGNMVQSVREQFRELVRRALHQFINDRINERLQHALDDGTGTVRIEQADAAPAAPAAGPAPLPEGVVAIDGEVVTTEDEVQAFLIVKAILREVVPVARVHMRDTKSYCGVLLDDNNRKPLIRLRFGKAKKSIGLFDAEKNEERFDIETIDDIFKHADRLKATVGFYLADD